MGKAKALTGTVLGDEKLHLRKEPERNMMQSINPITGATLEADVAALRQAYGPGAVDWAYRIQATTHGEERDYWRAVQARLEEIYFAEAPYAGR